MLVFVSKGISKILNLTFPSNSSSRLNLKEYFNFNSSTDPDISGLVNWPQPLEWRFRWMGVPTVQPQLPTVLWSQEVLSENYLDKFTRVLCCGQKGVLFVEFVRFIFNVTENTWLRIFRGYQWKRYRITNVNSRDVLYPSQMCYRTYGLLLLVTPGRTFDRWFTSVTIRTLCLLLFWVQRVLVSVRSHV